MNVKNGMIATFIVALQLTTYIAGAVIGEDFWTLKEKTNEGADFELRFTDLKDVLAGAATCFRKKSSEIVLVMPTSYGQKVSFKFYQTMLSILNLKKSILKSKRM